jgi:structural maintenance of chromosome 4
VEAIEKATEQVEVLAVDRSEKLNRVKIVEKEKDGLEDAKSEAEALFTKEMELLQLRNTHCQINLADAANKRADIEEAQTKLADKLQHEQEKNKDVMSQLADMEAQSKEATEKYDSIADQCEKANERFNSFQRRDIKYQEDIKHLKKQIDASKAKKKAEEKKTLKLEKEGTKLEEETIPSIQESIEAAEAKQVRSICLIDWDVVKSLFSFVQRVGTILRSGPLM